MPISRTCTHRAALHAADPLRLSPARILGTSFGTPSAAPGPRRLCRSPGVSAMRRSRYAGPDDACTRGEASARRACSPRSPRTSSERPPARDRRPSHSCIRGKQQSRGDYRVPWWLRRAPAAAAVRPTSTSPGHRRATARASLSRRASGSRDSAHLSAKALPDLELGSRDGVSKGNPPCGRPRGRRRLGGRLRAPRLLDVLPLGPG
jgi:hypothetical protein